MQLVAVALLEVALWVVYFVLSQSQRKTRPWQEALFVFVAVNLAAFLLGGWLVVGDVVTQEWRALLRGKW